MADAIYAAETDAALRGVGSVFGFLGGVGRFIDKLKTLSSFKSAIDGV